MDIRVSVVLPVYNHRDFVLDAIRSVFEQTHTPKELIIIDDGSTDGSPDSIREFLAANPAPEGLSVLFQARENRGAHITINEGIRRATGEYIALLNSDDLYMSNRIQRCLETARAQNSRILFTYVEPIDGTGAPLPVGEMWRIWYNHATLLNIQEHDCVSQTLLYGNIAVSTGNFFIRRGLFDEVGYFSNLRYCHDWDFLLRVCLIEEPVVLREKLYKYRIHDSNTAMEFNNYAIEETTVVIRDHLRRIFSTSPKNKWADVLEEHGFFFGGTGWLGLVGPAFDMLLERQSPRDDRPALRLLRRGAKGVGKRVTIVSHEMTYTGAPTIVLELACALAEKGVEVSVLTPVDGPLRHEFNRLGFPVHVVRPSDRLQGLFDRAQRWIQGGRPGRWLAKLLREIVRPTLKIDETFRLTRATWRNRGVLLINSFASWPFALRLLKRWRGAVFWYIHETYEPEFMMIQAKDNHRLRDLFSAGSIKFLYGSDATRALWASCGYDGVVCYWSGIRESEHAAVQGWKAGSGKSVRGRRRVVLSIGTAGGRKGTRHLVEAFAIGRSRGTIPNDVELCIVGCRPPSWHAQTRDLVRRVHRPDLLGFVRLTHIVEPAALAAYFDEANLYVQSSLMEGVPLALLDAMSRGLPIITTDVDGCKEAIIHDVCGLLVPPRQETAMADAIAQLLADDGTAARLGAAARRRFVEQFSLEATFDSIFTMIMQ